MFLKINKYLNKKRNICKKIDETIYDDETMKTKKVYNYKTRQVFFGLLPLFPCIKLIFNVSNAHQRKKKPTLIADDGVIERRKRLSVKFLISNVYRYFGRMCVSR